MLHALWSTAIKGRRDSLVFNFYQGGVSLALAAGVLPLVDLAEIGSTVWRWLTLTAVAHALYFYWLTLGATVIYGLADKAAMASLAGQPWSSPVPRSVVYYTLLASSSALLFSPVVLAQRGLRMVWAGRRANAVPASVASLLGLVGYGLILKALETAPASYTVAVRQSSVLFVIVLGVLQLRETPGRARVLGAIATVLGVGLIAVFGGP